MKLEHLFTSCSLVQAIYVLCYDSLKLSRFLQLSQLHMSSIGLSIRSKHFVFIELIKFLSLVNEKCMTHYLLRWIFILLIVETILTSEIRYTTFCGHPGTTKENYIIRFINCILQSFYHSFLFTSTTTLYVSFIV